jgi:hypothetical protein
MVFENRPAWVPNLDERAGASVKRQLSNGLSQFERTTFYAAKVRNVSSVGSQFRERLHLRQPPPTALFLQEAKEWSAERVDNGKTIYHLPMGQVFGVDPVAAEGQSGGDDCAVPK